MLQGVRARDIVKGDRHRLQMYGQRRGRGAIVETPHHALGVHDLRRDRLLATGAEKQIHAEELHGPEHADLLVPRNEDPERRRLDPAGRQRRPQAAAQERRDREADHAVQEPPRLLRPNEVVVDAPRPLEGGPHRGGRDLRECHPPEAVLGPAEQLPQMPGDRLTLSIEVRGEIDDACAVEAAQLSHHSCLRLDDLPRRLPSGLDVQAQRRTPA